MLTRYTSLAVIIVTNPSRHWPPVHCSARDFQKYVFSEHRQLKNHVIVRGPRECMKYIYTCMRHKANWIPTSHVYGGFFSPEFPRSPRPIYLRPSLRLRQWLYVIPAAAGSLYWRRRRRRSCDCNKSNLVGFRGANRRGKKKKTTRKSSIGFFFFSSFFFSFYSDIILYWTCAPRHPGRPLVTREKYEKHSQTNIHIFGRACVRVRKIWRRIDTWRTREIRYTIYTCMNKKHAHVYKIPSFIRNLNISCGDVRGPLLVVSSSYGAPRVLYKTLL